VQRDNKVSNPSVNDRSGRSEKEQSVGNSMAGSIDITSCNSAKSPGGAPAMAVAPGKYNWQHEMTPEPQRSIVDGHAKLNGEQTKRSEAAHRDLTVTKSLIATDALENPQQVETLSKSKRSHEVWIVGSEYRKEQDQPSSREPSHNPGAASTRQQQTSAVPQSSPIIITAGVSGMNAIMTSSTGKSSLIAEMRVEEEEADKASRDSSSLSSERTIPNVDPSVRTKRRLFETEDDTTKDLQSSSARYGANPEVLNNEAKPSRHDLLNPSKTSLAPASAKARQDDPNTQPGVNPEEPSQKSKFNESKDTTRDPAIVIGSDGAFEDVLSDSPTRKGRRHSFVEERSQARSKNSDSSRPWSGTRTAKRKRENSTSAAPTTKRKQPARRAKVGAGETATIPSSDRQANVRDEHSASQSETLHEEPAAKKLRSVKRRYTNGRGDKHAASSDMQASSDRETKETMKRQLATALSPPGRTRAQRRAAADAKRTLAAKK